MAFEWVCLKYTLLLLAWHSSSIAIVELKKIGRCETVDVDYKMYVSEVIKIKRWRSEHKKSCKLRMEYFCHHFGVQSHTRTSMWNLINISFFHLGLINNILMSLAMSIKFLQFGHLDSLALSLFFSYGLQWFGSQKMNTMAKCMAWMCVCVSLSLRYNQYDSGVCC